MLDDPDPISNLTFIRPSLSDADAVLELMVAVDIAEYGEPDSEIEDLLQEWQEIDLSQDVWLVYDHQNRVVGYGKVAALEEGFQMDFYVHPQASRSELHDEIITRCEKRVLEMQHDKGDQPVVDLKTIVSQANPENISTLEKHGYELVKYYLRMQCTMDQQPEKPRWLEGVHLRTINPGQDDLRVFDFVNSNISRAGRTPGDFERWRSWMMRADHFFPELWFLLFSDEDLIGVALCFDYEEYGWIRQLAVAPKWRRKWLGTALLQHSFRCFHSRGHRRVALGVEADNLDALEFYERVGMRRSRQFNEYVTRIASASHEAS